MRCSIGDEKANPSRVPHHARVSFHSEQHCERGPRRSAKREDVPSPSIESPMTTDIATAPPAVPTPNTNKVATLNRDGKRLQVRGKLKIALDSMVWQGLDWTDAAHKVNYTTQAMRKALERPHVIAYLREQKHVFRTLASSQNIHHAVRMRNEAGNEMAKLGAMKFIENEEQHAGIAGVSSRSPGVTIVIAAPAQAAAFITHEREYAAKPLISHAPVQPVGPIGYGTGSGKPSGQRGGGGPAGG